MSLFTIKFNARFLVGFFYVIFGLMTARSLEGALLGIAPSCICSYYLSCIKSKNFSFEDMFWFCSLLFFGIGFMQCYDSSGFYGWGILAPVDEGQALMACFLVCTFLFIVGYVEFFCSLRGRVDIQRIDNGNLMEQYKNKNFKIRKPILLVVLFIVSWCIYLYAEGGFGKIWMSRLERASLFEQAQGGTNLISIVCFAILVGTSIIYTIKFELEKRDQQSFLHKCGNYTLFIALLCGLFLLFNPFNSARFVLCGTYVPIIFLTVLRKLKILNVYLIFSFGLFILMPLMSISSRFGTLANYSESDYAKNSPFLLPDVDVVQMVAFSADRVDKIGISYGAKSVAIIGFFIPRSLWPEKPFASGYEIGLLKLNEGFAGTANLSSPIICDAYIDFYVPGVIFIAITIGYGMRRLREKADMNFSVSIISVMVMGWLPILIRGPVSAIIGIPLISMLIFYMLSKIYLVKTVK